MMQICYKLKNPVTFNGRDFHTEFMSYVLYDNRENAEKVVEKLNQEKPGKLFNGEKIDWDRIDYFFVNECNEDDFF